MTAEGKSTTVALALGGGGARGYAHIGVIEEIERRGWQIVGVSGTSIGSIVGGLYLAGVLGESAEWARTFSRRDVLTALDPNPGRPGLVSIDRVIATIRDRIGPHFLEDLPAPFTAVAVDVLTHEEVWFTEGELLEAIRCSIAIPGVFPPVARDGRVLADGGLLNPVPTSALAGVDADVVVAVDLSGPDAGAPVSDGPGLFDSSLRLPNPLRGLEQVSGAWRKVAGRDEPQGPTSTLEIADVAIRIMQDEITRLRLEQAPADVTVCVPYDSCGVLDFHVAGPMIGLGRELAVAAFDAWEAGAATASGDADSRTE